jgi:hypothetical protein
LPRAGRLRLHLASGCHRKARALSDILYRLR